MIKIVGLILLCFTMAIKAAASPPQKPGVRTIIIDPGHGGIDGGAQGKNTREAVLALEIGFQLRSLINAEMPEVKVLMTRESDELPGGLYNKNAALRWRANFANTNNGDLFISIHLNASPQNQKYARRGTGEYRTETYYVYTGKGKNRKKVAKTRTVEITERYQLPPKVRGTMTLIVASNAYNQKAKAVAANSNMNEVMMAEMGEKDSLDPEMVNIDPVLARIMRQQYTKLYFQKSLSLANTVEDGFNQLGRYSFGVWQRDWEAIWVLQATQMPAILVETGFVDHPEEEAYLSSKKGQEETARVILNAIKQYKQGVETTPPAADSLKLPTPPLNAAGQGN
ncbi:MAG: N-acetylmuramoyl-L-alanine amidase [Bacteroidetes bacterium]|nr:MAG: N-acetylmuramoyl-L-alanine amidase [Bacteroidota bacterium]